MTKKKKLSVIAVSVSAVVCVALAALLWWKMTRPERIEIPIPGLSWGMSAEEVSVVLEEAGVHDVSVSGVVSMGVEDVKFGAMKLSAEELKLLGAEDVLGLSFSTRNTYAVMLRFAGSYANRNYNSVGDGTLRLTQVEFWVEVPEGTSLMINRTLNNKLNSAYGKPDIPGWWTIIGDEARNVTMDGEKASYFVSPHVQISQKDCYVCESVLVYNGAGYVQLLHGGYYSTPQGWR